MRDSIINIPKDDPFKNDKFDRDVIAENFMNIFDADKDGIVLAIDSDWGTGKTTFIKMWESLVNNDDRYKDNYCSIYFNAWDNDYLEDPLLAILTEIKLRENNGEDQVNLAPEIFKEIFTPIYIVVKRGFDIGLKLGTSGAIGVDDVFKMKEDDTQEKILEKMNEIGNEVLNRCANARILRDEFKDKLSKFNDEYNKKLIFFIDELDRCRPKFAIELLETIKHLFSAPGIIFVISLDKNQLSHSVATVYGQNMDTVGYLRRFFDIDYKLPRADKIKYMNVKNQNTFEGYLNTKYLEQFLDGFIIGYNFSLRDIDKLHYYMKILMPLITEYREHYPPDDCKVITISYLYAYLISLKIKRPDLYDKIINVEYDYDSYNYDEVLEINEINNFNFYKKGELDQSIIDIIQSNVISNFLILNYLHNANSDKAAKFADKKFDIELSSKNKFNMRELFNCDGNYYIMLNMEFMNSLGE